MTEKRGEPVFFIGRDWRGEPVPRLALGTAQLGIPGYGVSSRDCVESQEEADAVIRAAWNCGVRFYDTAQGYGDSEKKLGAALKNLGISRDDAKIITKIDPTFNPSDLRAIRVALETSSGHLGGGQLWGVMLHRFEWLERWGNGLGDMLKGIRNEKAVKWLGVSVYSPEEALAAILHPDMDIIQVPANAWDGRLARAGVFAKARERGKMLFVRSVFLQGLLLLPPSEAEVKAPGSGKPAALWGELCARIGKRPMHAALDWGAATGWPIVVGAEAPMQVQEIAERVAGARGECPQERLIWDEDNCVLDPVKWGKA